MKQSIPWLASALIALTACAIASAAGSAAVMLPEGAGRTKFIELCSNCHEMSIVIAQGRTRSEWGDMISTMVDRGAVVADPDFAVIQQYLAEYFPPKPAASPESP